MSDRPVLHTCQFRELGASVGHPCGRAAAALREAGQEFSVHKAGIGHPFGVMTGGRRPELKALSGQEKLPVLELEDGTTVNGSAAIVAWARDRSPSTA